MMVVMRFVWFLVAPLLAPLAIIPLLVLWLLLSVVLGVWTTWQRAQGKPVEFTRF